MATVSPLFMSSVIPRRIETGPARDGNASVTPSSAIMDSPMLPLSFFPSPRSFRRPQEMIRRLEKDGPKQPSLARVPVAGLLFILCLLLLRLPFSSPVPSGWARTPPSSPPSTGYLILGFGDSLMAGYGLDPGMGFVPRLESALRAEGLAVTVINAGVSGDTTSAGRARLSWVLDGLARKPDLVLLELGANDALRGIDPRITRANLDAMLSLLAKRGLRVLLVGMRAPPNLGPEYRQAFDRIYPELAARHRTCFYPFFLEGVAARPSLNQADGLHPNARGVEEIVRRIVPAVRQALIQGCPGEGHSGITSHPPPSEEGRERPGLSSGQSDR